MGQSDYILGQFGKPRDAAMLISLSSVVCDVLYSGETAGPICMNAPQLLHRSSAMGQYGRPS